MFHQMVNTTKHLAYHCFFRSCMRPKFILNPSTSTPKSVAFVTVRITSADFNNAFVGMHPLCKQVPPSNDFSTNATFFPNCEALIADT